MCVIYRKKNARKARRWSRNEANESAPRVQALNDWRLEESFINDFPAPLNQKIVNR